MIEIGQFDAPRTAAQAETERNARYMCNYLRFAILCRSRWQTKVTPQVSWVALVLPTRRTLPFLTHTLSFWLICCDYAAAYGGAAAVAASGNQIFVTLQVPHVVSVTILSLVCSTLACTVHAERYTVAANGR